MPALEVRAAEAPRLELGRGDPEFTGRFWSERFLGLRPRSQPEQPQRPCALSLALLTSFLPPVPEAASEMPEHLPGLPRRVTHLPEEACCPGSHGPTGIWPLVELEEQQHTLLL